MHILTGECDSHNGTESFSDLEHALFPLQMPLYDGVGKTHNGRLNF